jgi:hypothetical protein
MTPPFTLYRIGLLLVFYAMLGAVISLHGRRLTSDERKTFLLLWGAGFSIAIVANYLLFLAGAMTFLPWINNFLHTFLWIGLGFPYLYFGTRGRSPIIVFAVFCVLSLIVKYAEQLLFGTWEGTSFLGIIPGNLGYILGWSVMDGTMPFVISFGLPLVGKIVPGLVYE